MRFALLCLVLACSSRTSVERSAAEGPGSVASAASAARSATSTGSIDAAIAAPPIDAASCAAGSNIPNGACAKDSDCVLTNLADACGACDVPRAYVTRKVTLDAHVAGCATTSPCTAGCPPRANYIRAFYRAECRSHRCIAWRYHGGG